MSIRLRLTLLYSAILALTLAIFSLVLYSVQARYTLDSLKSDLRQSSDRLAQATLRTHEGPVPAELERQSPPPPMPFDEFSGERVFRELSERQIARVLNPDGELVASPFGREEDILPLSEAGLQALQAEQEWWQTELVEEQRMLIYSRPVVVDGQVAYIVQVALPLTERDRTLQALGSTLVIASLLVSLAAFGVGWALAGVTLRPIDRITQTAQTIGSERDFTRRVEYRGPPDEVGRLATTFNSMLAQLQSAYQRVAHSLEMQRNFVADVSHELRTPLTTLRGNLGLLDRTPPLPEDEQREVLGDMVDESDRLIRLVNDLLTLARADVGHSLARGPVELGPLLEEVCRQARQLDPQRAVNLQADPGVTIQADRDALKQVMLILLDNALKHTTGKVTVTAEATSSQALVTVRDRGPGLPAEQLEHVFDRFYRGESGSEAPGFGLGLPIARALVDSMGGSIQMESTLGAGSQVCVVFKIAPQDFQPVRSNAVS